MLNKNQLSEDLLDYYQEIGIRATKLSAEQIVNFICLKIQGALVKNQEVNLPELGKFKAVIAKGRMARNPKTGMPVQVPDKVKAKFIGSKKLLEALNKV